MNSYYNPVRSFQGWGATAVLPELARKAATPGSRVLLLYWNISVLNQPGIRELAAAAHVDKFCFCASNPELDQLYETYAALCEKRYGLIVAVGGGSVMDIGKSLCVLFGEAIESVDALRSLIAEKRWPAPACRWIGVPTTAGTGSETTCWATIWDTQKLKKYSIDTPENYAYAAVVDPALTTSMPVKLAVSSALDAVAHATESYWARASNAVSRSLALEAIHGIMGEIDALCDNPANRDALDAMSRGSMLAGLAFSGTRTTACHSISYPLTMELHIPHGVAVSLLLGPVFRLNAPAIAEPERLLAAWGVRTPEEIGPRVTALLSRVGHPVTLQAWGATEAILPQLVANSMTKGRADNNPLALTPEIVRSMLESLM